MVGRCSRESRYSRIGGGRGFSGDGDRCPRGSRDSRVGVEGIFVAGRVGAIGVLGGLGLGCKEGLWGLSAF